MIIYICFLSSIHLRITVCENKEENADISVYLNKLICLITEMPSLQTKLCRHSNLTKTLFQPAKVCV